MQVQKNSLPGEKAIIRLVDEKIAKDARWDGLHGVITNLKEESAVSIIARYACYLAPQRELLVITVMGPLDQQANGTMM